MGYKPNYKHRFWSMSIISIMLLALWIGTIVQREGLWRSLEAKETELAECGAGWYTQLEMTATLITMNEENNPARVGYLEGQLEACTGAYVEESVNRKFYQDALENVSPYCSEGLDQLVIDGLREELHACQYQRKIPACREMGLQPRLEE